MHFSELPLPSYIGEVAADLGFETPTAIQEETIPLLLAGRDVVGIAQTGTGKTAAFGLPLVAHIDPERAEMQALVLAPTRELAQQVSSAIESFAAFDERISIATVYGGSSYGPQLRALRSGAQITVGTPGRIRDLLKRGALDIAQLEFFVLDEADEMLSMGFAEEVEEIAGYIQSEPITALFSATMKPQIERIASHLLRSPAKVAVTRPSTVVSTVEQQYAVVPYKQKITALSRVLAVREAPAAIVFVRTKLTAEEVALELSRRSIAAAAISGDVPQRDRERMIEHLRSGVLNVLVATDVAARGLDVDRIGLVVNFDVPREAEAYVHRIGRTGRAGRAGRALSFFTPAERSRLRVIEKATGTELTPVDLPTASDVRRHHALAALAAAQETDPEIIADFRDILSEVRSDVVYPDGSDMPDDALLPALLAVAVARSSAGGMEDVEEKIGTSFAASGRKDRADRGPRGKRVKQDRGPSAGGTRFRISVGHRDGVSPGAIVGAITGESSLSGSDLGRIDIYPSFSLVDIYGDLSETDWRNLQKATVAGRRLRIAVDRGPDGGRGSDRGYGGGRSRGGYGGRDSDRRKSPRKGFGRSENSDSYYR